MHGEQMGLLGTPGVNLFGLLIIGLVAGYVAEKAMNRDHSLLTNILVGIAGSFVGGTLAGVVGIEAYGFFAKMLIAVFGAILILWFFGRSEKRN